MSRHLAIELLSSYVDEEVSPRQLCLVEEHLESCAECRDRLDGLRAVARSVRRLESVPPPATLSSAVERRLRLEARDSASSRSFEDRVRHWIGQPVLAPAFAVVMAMGAIIYLFSLGVSDRVGGPTRLVVASAPTESEEAADGEAMSDSLDLDSGANQELGAASGASGGRADAKSRRNRKETTLRESVAPAAPVARAPRPKAETDLVAKVSEPKPDDGASDGQAQGRIEARRRSTAAQVPAQEGFADAPAELAELTAMPETVEIAGRSFRRQGESWVEAGTENDSVAETLDLSGPGSELPEELVPFVELGRARLRLGDRVVEVIYPDAGSS